MKGFKFTKFIEAQNQSKNTQYEVYAGNFYMELILPNAFKVNSLKKLGDKLNKYIESHNGKLPQSISVSPRQYCEYETIFPRYILPVPPLPQKLQFHGIPLLPRK